MFWVVLGHLLYLPFQSYWRLSRGKTEINYEAQVAYSLVITLFLPLLLIAGSVLINPSRVSIGSNSLGPFLFPLGVNRRLTLDSEINLQQLELLGYPFGPILEINIGGYGAIFHPALYTLLIMIMLATSLVGWIINLKINTLIRKKYLNLSPSQQIEKT